MNTLTPGMRHAETHTVEQFMTAKSMKSGASDVFATPYLIALMENVCLECVQPCLEPGQGTVGTAVNVRHTAATPVGMQVRFECELLEIDRRRMLFKVAAYDERELIGQGEHERFVVDLDRHAQKAREKLAQQ